jgi:polyhydroxybutyrate depolymerase
LPVVLLFHGFSLSAEFMADYANIAQVSDERGFIAVVPHGQGDPAFWNTGVAGAADDLAFVRELLAQLERDLCVDSARVYAIGYSNGGGMSQLLSCALHDRIAAVGVVASTHLLCEPQTPVIGFHGDADPNQQFAGGRGVSAGAPEGVGGTFAPVRERFARWAAALRCNPSPAISQPADDVELSTYQNCSTGGGDVLLYTIIGGGHTWPGATIDIGDTTQSISATALAWVFFEAHSIAIAPVPVEAPRAGSGRLDGGGVDMRGWWYGVAAAGLLLIACGAATAAVPPPETS